MYSADADHRARVLHAAKRVFAHLRNVFAVIGVLLLAVTVFVFSKGSEMTHGLDDRARRALGDLVVKLEGDDIAGALVIRAMLPDGAGHVDAIKAMRRRAKEIDFQIIGAQRYSLAESDRNNSREITIIDFCGKKTWEELLALRPELGALMPCTVLLVGESGGPGWVAMLNVETLLYGGRRRNPALEARLLSMKDRMLDVMAAAVAVPGKQPAAN